MQARAAALPELERSRSQPVAAPVLRAWRIIAVPGLDFSDLRVQRVQCHRLALRRCPGADPCPERPALVIRIGILWCDVIDHALDANLPLERLPEEQQAGPGLVGDFPALARKGIGVENESFGIETLAQHDARGRTAACVRGCQRHGGRFRHFRGQCLVKPERKLVNGRGFGGALEQHVLFVLLAKGGDRHGDNPVRLTGLFWWGSVRGLVYRARVPEAGQRCSESRRLARSSRWSSQMPEALSASAVWST